MAKRPSDGIRFPNPMPYGWFGVCYSDELGDKGIHSLTYFDQDIVLFRGEDGAPRAMDAYCEHMGAHLGGGEVVGNNIACPFHAWEYDGEGKVVNIPYAKKIPPQVKKPCMKVWPTTEANGMVWMWYHPEDSAPLWDVTPHEETSSDEWAEFGRKEWIVDTHPLEMAENAADVAHFKYVHGTDEFPTDWDIKVDGPMRSGFVEAPMRTPKGVVPGKIENFNRGPGEAWTRFSGIADTFLLSSLTPLARDKVHVRFSFWQKKVDAETFKSGVSKAFIQEVIKQFEEDKPIWDNKIHLKTIRLCDGDGPIMDLRKWYSQFFVEGAA